MTKETASKWRSIASENIIAPQSPWDECIDMEIDEIRIPSQLNGLGVTIDTSSEFRRVNGCMGVHIEFCNTSLNVVQQAGAC